MTKVCVLMNRYTATFRVCFFLNIMFWLFTASVDIAESSDSGQVVPQDAIKQEPFLPPPLPPGPAEEPQSQVLSSLRLENQLLRNEVASLNGEMASVIQRAKDLQDGKTPEGQPCISIYQRSV